LAGEWPSNSQATPGACPLTASSFSQLHFTALEGDEELQADSSV
jgi:hypothetical protein